MVVGSVLILQWKCVTACLVTCTRRRPFMIPLVKATTVGIQNQMESIPIDFLGRSHGVGLGVGNQTAQATSMAEGSLNGTRILLRTRMDCVHSKTECLLRTESETLAVVSSNRDILMAEIRFRKGQTSKSARLVLSMVHSPTTNGHVPDL